MKGKESRSNDVLKNINFEVFEGETVGIIGTNGAGKSTLLQIVTGTLEPTSGLVEINGDMSALLELGAGFNPEFTGEENVYLSCSLMGMKAKEIEKIIPWIKEFADIGEFYCQPVKTYSSGMFVRLAFSVAVCKRPKILIVDEALAVGDIFFQNKCLEFMRKELLNTTKLIVTHDMHTVTSMCDKVILIDGGEISYIGDPLTGVESYLKNYQNKAFKNTKTISGQKNETLEILSDQKSKNWIKIPESKVSGSLNQKITDMYVELDSLGDGKYLVNGTQLVKVNFKIESISINDEAIIGILISDKFGNSIFGYNNLGEEVNRELEFNCGIEEISIEFEWPKIRPGEYFITLGIGRGTDPLNHNIECWAHNIIAVKTINPKDVFFSQFNLPFKIEKIGESH
ncbi:ABC transporter ATP-binding protein [Enterovibrio norvegicus]|nr:ABC transporter ATP-binding protein [Enterovibrio norvegicus]